MSLSDFSIAAIAGAATMAALVGAYLAVATSRTTARTTARMTDELETVLLELRTTTARTRLDSIVVSGTGILTEETIPSAQLIREISHSLNTPLAQIELALEEASSTRSYPPREVFRTAQESIELCRAVLTAYRGLTTLVDIDSEGLSYVPELVENAFRAARKQFGNGPVAIRVGLPETLPGYPNNYIAALLLPLLQNAAESAPKNSTVWVDYSRHREHIAIAVRNLCEDPKAALEGAERRRGKSPKEGHEGIGLDSVRTLLSRTRNSRLDVRVQRDEFIAEVVLPSRRLPV